MSRMTQWSQMATEARSLTEDEQSWHVRPLTVAGLRKPTEPPPSVDPATNVRQHAVQVLHEMHAALDHLPRRTEAEALEWKRCRVCLARYADALMLEDVRTATRTGGDL